MKVLQLQEKLCTCNLQLDLGHKGFLLLRLDVGGIEFVLQTWLELWALDQKNTEQWETGKAAFLYPDRPVPARLGPAAGGPASPPVPSVPHSALFGGEQGLSSTVHHLQPSARDSVIPDGGIFFLSLSFEIIESLPRLSFCSCCSRRFWPSRSPAFSRASSSAQWNQVKVKGCFFFTPEPINILFFICGAHLCTAAPPPAPASSAPPPAAPSPSAETRGLQAGRRRLFVTSGTDIFF